MMLVSLRGEACRSSTFALPNIAAKRRARVVRGRRTIRGGYAPARDGRACCSKARSIVSRRSWSSNGFSSNATTPEDDGPGRSVVRREHFDHGALVGEADCDWCFGVFFAKQLDELTAVSAGGFRHDRLAKQRDTKRQRNGHRDETQPTGDDPSEIREARKLLVGDGLRVTNRHGVVSVLFRLGCKIDGLNRM